MESYDIKVQCFAWKCASNVLNALRIELSIPHWVLAQIRFERRAWVLVIKSLWWARNIYDYFQAEAENGRYKIVSVSNGVILNAGKSMVLKLCRNGLRNPIIIKEFGDVEAMFMRSAKTGDTYLMMWLTIDDKEYRLTLRPTMIDFCKYQRINKHTFGVHILLNQVVQVDVLAAINETWICPRCNTREEINVSECSWCGKERVMDDSDFWAEGSTTDDELDSDEIAPQRTRNPSKHEWNNQLKVKWSKLCMSHDGHLLCDLRCKDSFACMISGTSILRIQFDRVHMFHPWLQQRTCEECGAQRSVKEGKKPPGCQFWVCDDCRQEGRSLLDFVKSVITQKRWHRDKVSLNPPATANMKAVKWVYSWLNRLEKLLRSTTAVLAVYSPMINHCPMYAPEDLYESCLRENVFYELTEMPKKVELELGVVQSHAKQVAENIIVRAGKSIAGGKPRTDLLKEKSRQRSRKIRDHDIVNNEEEMDPVNLWKKYLKIAFDMERSALNRVCDNCYHIHPKLVTLKVPVGLCNRGIDYSNAFGNGRQLNAWNCSVVSLSFHRKVRKEEELEEDLKTDYEQFMLYTYRHRVNFLLNNTLTPANFFTASDDQIKHNSGHFLVDHGLQGDLVSRIKEAIKVETKFPGKYLARLGLLCSDTCPWLKIGPGEEAEMADLDEIQEHLIGSYTCRTDGCGLLEMSCFPLHETGAMFRKGSKKGVLMRTNKRRIRKLGLPDVDPAKCVMLTRESQRKIRKLDINCEHIQLKEFIRWSPGRLNVTLLTMMLTPRERIMFKRGCSLYFNNQYTDGWTKGILHEIIRINADLNGDVKYVITLEKDSLDFFVCEAHETCFSIAVLQEVMSQEQLFNMLDSQHCIMMYKADAANEEEEELEGQEEEEDSDDELADKDEVSDQQEVEDGDGASENEDDASEVEDAGVDTGDAQEVEEVSEQETPEIVPVGDLISGRFKSVDFETGLVLLHVKCGDNEIVEVTKHYTELILQERVVTKIMLRHHQEWRWSNQDQMAVVNKMLQFSDFHQSLLYRALTNRESFMKLIWLTGRPLTKLQHQEWVQKAAMGDFRDVLREKQVQDFLMEQAERMVGKFNISLTREDWPTGNMIVAPDDEQILKPNQIFYKVPAPPEPWECPECKWRNPKYAIYCCSKKGCHVRRKHKYRVFVGDVVIIKNPMSFPEHVRTASAVMNEHFDRRFPGPVLIYSTRGYVSQAYTTSFGDYDGDKPMVICNPEIVRLFGPPKINPPVLTLSTNKNSDETLQEDPLTSVTNHILFFQFSTRILTPLLDKLCDELQDHQMANNQKSRDFAKRVSTSLDQNKQGTRVSCFPEKEFKTGFTPLHSMFNSKFSKAHGPLVNKVFEQLRNEEARCYKDIVYKYNVTWFYQKWKSAFDKMKKSYSSYGNSQHMHNRRRQHQMKDRQQQGGQNRQQNQNKGRR